MVSNKFTFLMASLLCMPTSCMAGVHPFHLSTAELEMNAKSGRVEVALKIHGSDLERALTASNNAVRVSIGDDGKAFPHIERYLNQHFVLAADAKLLGGDEESNATGTASTERESEKKSADKFSRAKVIGSEFRNNWLWIYFEIKLPERLASQSSESPWQLRNTLLLDIVDSQINTIAIRNKKGRLALRTSARKPVVELPASWLDPDNSIPREN